MLLPDCRNDETYNERFLEDRDEQYVSGFDTAVDSIITLFADNLDVYENELTELCPEGYTPEYDECFAKRKDLYNIVVENKEILCAIIKDWLESERNEIITSCIDSMEDEVYDKIKEEVLTRQPELREKLYDTRKLYSGTSGSKQDT